MNSFSNPTQELIFQHQGLVKSLAWRIHQKLPPQVDLQDLIGFGQIGLAEAARDFEPRHGCAFGTYAYHRVRGAIFDGLSKMTWFSRADYWQGRYVRMSQEFLSVEDSSDPAEATLQSELGWVRQTGRKLSTIYLFSQVAPNANSYQPAVESGTDDLPQANMIRSELNSRLHALIETLPSNMADLIRLTYFDGLTLTDAGERIGISKAWASRLHARAIDELSRKLHLSDCV